MMIPDYALIAEIMLYAEGFDESKSLSNRMIKMYKLCSEQLSQQRHYDYGLRAVRSVLVMAGGLKRANPQLDESVVLIKAMRDSNQPKFLEDVSEKEIGREHRRKGRIDLERKGGGGNSISEEQSKSHPPLHQQDLPLFKAILTDLFPGLVIPVDDFGALEQAIRKDIRKKGLQLVDGFIAKVIQLFETFNVRFGVSIVGPTTAGKTVARRILADACTALREEGNEDERFQLSRYNELNPKCITMGELYGEFNELTQEWKDGLASTLMRNDTKDTTEDRKYTVFDGPVDALWIENMNTVLDDNQMLCLANGERIRLLPSMRMVFEVQDLEVASPATVSRLGVVYMTPVDLGHMPIVISWLERLEKAVEISEDHRAQIVELFGKLDAGFDFLKKCVQPVQTVKTQIAQSCCNIFESLFNIRCKDGLDALRKAGDDAKLSKVINKIFAFSYTWTIGGCVKSTDWDAIGDFIQEQLDNVNYGRFSVFEVCIATEAGEKFGEFTPWQEHVPKFQFDPADQFFSMVVPTIDTVRYAYLMRSSYLVRGSTFFTGITGTGKSVIVQDLLNHMAMDKESGGDNVAPVTVNFSGQTDALLTQSSIEAKLEKKRKGIYGPPAGKDMIIFVDDINMPVVEEYGAQPPIELLRQFQDYSGFYDREKVASWKTIENAVLMIAAAPPGGGRAEVTKRFSRHFHVVCLPPASTAALKTIFESILDGFLSQKFLPEVKNMTAKIVQGTIEVYDRIAQDLRPTPAKSHYTFNLRDVAKVVQGMMMVKPKHANSEKRLCKLHVHEMMRVFHDRLINDDDRHHFIGLLLEVSNRLFSFGFDAEEVGAGRMSNNVSSR